MNSRGLRQFSAQFVGGAMYRMTQAVDLTDAAVLGIVHRAAGLLFQVAGHVTGHVAHGLFDVGPGIVAAAGRVRISIGVCVGHEVLDLQRQPRERTCCCGGNVLGYCVPVPRKFVAGRCWLSICTRLA